MIHDENGNLVRDKNGAWRDPTGDEATARASAAELGKEWPEPEPLVSCSRCGAVATLGPDPDVRFEERDGGWFHGNRPTSIPPAWLQVEWIDLEQKRDELVDRLERSTRTHYGSRWVDGREQYTEPIAWINAVIGAYSRTAHLRLGHPHPCGGGWGAVRRRRWIRLDQRRIVSHPSWLRETPEARTKRVVEHLAGYAERNGLMTLGADR
jgi:hypothetical protein